MGRLPSMIAFRVSRLPSGQARDPHPVESSPNKTPWANVGRMNGQSTPNDACLPSRRVGCPPTSYTSPFLLVEVGQHI